MHLGKILHKKKLLFYLQHQLAKSTSRCNTSSKLTRNNCFKMDWSIYENNLCMLKDKMIELKLSFKVIKNKIYSSDLS